MQNRREKVLHFQPVGFFIHGDKLKPHPVGHLEKTPIMHITHRGFPLCGGKYTYAIFNPSSSAVRRQEDKSTPGRPGLSRNTDLSPYRKSGLSSPPRRSFETGGPRHRTFRIRKPDHAPVHFPPMPVSFQHHDYFPAYIRKSPANAALFRQVATFLYL